VKSGLGEKRVASAARVVIEKCEWFVEFMKHDVFHSLFVNSEIQFLSKFLMLYCIDVQMIAKHAKFFVKNTKGKQATKVIKKLAARATTIRTKQRANALGPARLRLIRTFAVALVVNRAFDHWFFQLGLRVQLGKEQLPGFQAKSGRQALNGRQPYLLVSTAFERLVKARAYTD